MDEIAEQMMNFNKQKKYNPTRPVDISLGGVKCFSCEIPRHPSFINYYCGEDLCKLCCNREYVHYSHEVLCKECKDHFESKDTCFTCDLCRVYCCNCTGKTIGKLKDAKVIEENDDDDFDELVTSMKIK